MLAVDGITVSYGASQVLFGVSLAIAQGEAVALLGRNGMGKTTTIKAVVGALRPNAGAIALDGVSLVGLPAHVICRRGIGYVPEGRRIFQHLTVDEQLAAFVRRGPDAWKPARIYDLFPGLAQRRSSPAGLLSGGEQQMLAIGRALATGPRLLILDEATEGLAPLVRERIWEVLAALKAGGLSILVVDKNVDDIVALADTAFVMEKGRVAWNGPAGDLKASDAAARRYLGV